MNRQETGKATEWRDLLRAELLQEDDVLQLEHQRSGSHGSDEPDPWRRIVGHLDDVNSEDQTTQTRLRALRRRVLAGRIGATRYLPPLPVSRIGYGLAIAAVLLISVFLFPGEQNSTSITLSTQVQSKDTPSAEAAIDFGSIDFYHWLSDYGEQLEHEPTDT